MARVPDNARLTARYSVNGTSTLETWHNHRTAWVVVDNPAWPAPRILERKDATGYVNAVVDGLRKEDATVETAGLTPAVLAYLTRKRPLRDIDKERLVFRGELECEEGCGWRAYGVWGFAGRTYALCLKHGDELERSR